MVPGTAKLPLCGSLAVPGTNTKIINFLRIKNKTLAKLSVRIFFSGTTIKV
jgi:hypothetical protein